MGTLVTGHAEFHRGDALACYEQGGRDVSLAASIRMETGPPRGAPEPAQEIELKYLVDPLLLEPFCATLEAHAVPEIHDRTRPVSFTRTTYLDTATREYFHSVAPRRRLRIREYAAAASIEDEALLTGVCFLELKESLDGMRRKVRWRAPAGLIRTIVARSGLVAVDRGVPDELLARLREERPMPVATTWYRRRAFLAAGGIRVTIDDPPWLCRPAATAHKGMPARPADPRAILSQPVVELKLGGPMPEWLRSAVAMLPAARSISKFRLAMSVV